jgi:3-oxoacyl-ACP reductase-like protein
METEGAMLTPSIKEVAAAAAEAGAAAVGAAQAAAAAAAAARGGSFGRGLDDWIVPASDALRLSWVLGTALRVDLVAQLLTVGFKVS